MSDSDTLEELIKNFIKQKDEIIMNDISRMASLGVLTVYEMRPTAELIGNRATIKGACRLMFTGEMEIVEQRNKISMLKMEVEKLQIYNRKMREALEFYADEKNWEDADGDLYVYRYNRIIDTDLSRPEGCCDLRGGKYARAVLVEIKREALGE